MPSTTTRCSLPLVRSVKVYPNQATWLRRGSFKHLKNSPLFTTLLLFSHNTSATTSVVEKLLLLYFLFLFSSVPFVDFQCNHWTGLETIFALYFLFQRNRIENTFHFKCLSLIIIVLVKAGHMLGGDETCAA